MSIGWDGSRNEHVQTSIWSRSTAGDESALNTPRSGKPDMSGTAIPHCTWRSPPRVRHRRHRAVACQGRNRDGRARGAWPESVGRRLRRASPERPLEMFPADAPDRDEDGHRRDQRDREAQTTHPEGFSGSGRRQRRRKAVRGRSRWPRRGPGSRRSIPRSKAFPKFQPRWIPIAARSRRVQHERGARQHAGLEGDGDQAEQCWISRLRCGGPTDSIAGLRVE